MWIAVAYLWVINGLTLLVFGWDKLRARRRKRRVPESKLLWLAALGGSPGAFLGRWIFRHKSRKRGFTATLFGLLGIQALILYLLISANVLETI